MFSRIALTLPLCATTVLVMAGCGGSNTASKKPSSKSVVATLSAPATGKVPTPAPTPTTIPQSDFTAVVAGVVTDHKSHAPVAGVSVVVGARLKSTTTDAQGHYRVAYPARAEISVIASKAGYAGALAVGKLPPNGHVTLNLQITKNAAGAPPVPPMPKQFGSR